MDISGVLSPGCSRPPSPGGDGGIRCVLQDCSSPESTVSPDPKRPGDAEAASGSQEKLDFNRNLKEGKRLSR